MSIVVLEKELVLIRERLQAIEEALGEEMTAEDKTALEEALEEALKEHKRGKSIPFKRKRSRARRR